MRVDDRCYARHRGPWVMEPHAFSSAFNAWKNGKYAFIDIDDDYIETSEEMLVTVGDDGVAVVRVIGAMSKGWSKFGGTSTMALRSAMARLRDNPQIRGVVMFIDTPGGSVSGLSELARVVRETAAVRPVYAYADGMCCSAGLWVASQATRVYAEPLAEIGSIGTVCVVYDESKKYEAEGIRTIVVSSGDRKGDFYPGSEVSDDAIAGLQAQIDEITDAFVSSVASGRGMSEEAVRELATGETWLAASAQRLGLIDAVAGYEDVMSAMRSVLRDEDARAARRDAELRSRRTRS